MISCITHSFLNFTECFIKMCPLMNVQISPPFLDPSLKNGWNFTSYKWQSFKTVLRSLICIASKRQKIWWKTQPFVVKPSNLLPNGFKWQRQSLFLRWRCTQTSTANSNAHDGPVTKQVGIPFCPKRKFAISHRCSKRYSVRPAGR